MYLFVSCQFFFISVYVFTKMLFTKREWMVNILHLTNNLTFRGLASLEFMYNNCAKLLQVLYYRAEHGLLHGLLDHCLDHYHLGILSKILHSSKL